MVKGVLLIRPKAFAFNRETAMDNAFAENVKIDSLDLVAIEEFNNLVNILKKSNINVIVFDDFNPSLGPDVVFPNNWFSTHPNGLVFEYPMCHVSRRKERRSDIIEYLRNNYKVKEVMDLSSAETKHCFLEGTGSIVFDHQEKVAYAAISHRTDVSLLTDVCEKLNYEPFSFNTKHNIRGKPIYHTNVLMAVGKSFVVCCTDLIDDQDVDRFKRRIEQSRKKLIDISCHQIEAFAGNILQIENTTGKLNTIMSDRAFTSFTGEQLKDIRADGEIIHSAIPTIENVGGGGIRCMIAEILLESK